MAFIASCKGKRVYPHGVESGAKLECVECNEPMHVVSSYPRNGRLIVWHFRHNSDGTTAGGKGGGCSGGESDLHARVKGIALDHVINHYADVNNAGIEGTIGQRQADAWIEFSAPQMPLGNGIAIEVQYRHDAKDIEAVERNYLQHGYSVLWIDAEEDYYPAQDHRIDLPTPIPVWPNAVPDHPPLDEIRYGEWLFDTYDDHRGTHRSLIANALNIDCPSPKLDVHLPPEHYEAVEQQLYRDQHWNDLFPGTEYERAISECDLEPSEPVRVNGNIPFAHWLLERRDAVGEERPHHHARL